MSPIFMLLFVCVLMVLFVVFAFQQKPNRSAKEDFIELEQENEENEKQL